MDINNIDNTAFRIGDVSYIKKDYYIVYNNKFGQIDAVNLENKYTVNDLVFDEFQTFKDLTYSGSNEFNSIYELSDYLTKVITYSDTIDINGLIITTDGYIEEVNREIFRISGISYIRGDYLIVYDNRFGSTDSINIKNKYTEDLLFESPRPYTDFTYTSGSFTSLEELGTFLSPIISYKYLSAAGGVITGDINFNNNSIIDINGIGFTGGQEITWNPIDLTIEIPSGLGPILQVGQELWVRVYNNTGYTLLNGKVIYPSGGATGGIPHVDHTLAETHETISNQVAVLTMDILPGESGFATSFGVVRGIDTTGFTEGAPVYISPIISGSLTSTKPLFPYYQIDIGYALDSTATGSIFVEPVGTVEDTFNNFWNGTFRESFTFDVISDGTNITGSLIPTDGNINMTMIFSDGFSILNSNPAADVILVAGIDSVPQMNYVYVLKSTKALAVSTSGWPATEHIKVSKVFLQSAATTATDDALGNQFWNDHIQSADDQMGHLAHIGQKLRKGPAQWESGTELTTVLRTVPNPDELYITVTGGVVYQLHTQTIESFDTEVSDYVYVVNDSITPYTQVQDLATIILDINGNTLSNKHYSLVVWGSANSGLEPSKLFVNLPRGSYLGSPNAINDPENYSVYTIPKEFDSTGFLIARIVLQFSGGTANMTITEVEDLRGKVPNTSAGGGSVGGSGATTYLGLTDTDSSYSTFSGNVPFVNVLETALEFRPIIESDISNLGTYYSASNPSNFVPSGSGISNFNNDINYIVSGSNISQFANDIGYITGSGSVGAVDSVFGRSGSVIAVDGDYNSFYVNKTGDTMTGALGISNSSPTINLTSTTSISGDRPTINFETPSNQGVSIEHTQFDGELPIDGYGLIVGATPTNTQFPSTGSLTFNVLGEIYAGANTVGGLSKVWHAGNDGAGSGLDAGLLSGNPIASTSNWFSSIPYTSPSGVTEVGRYIDFHFTDTDAGDNNGRLELTSANNWSFNGNVQGSSFSTTGGGFVSLNPNNAGASVSLNWLSDVARLRIGGAGAGATSGFAIQKSGDGQLFKVDNGGNATFGADAGSGGDGNIRVNNHAVNGTSTWHVSSADISHQRADARTDNTDEARLHWYGINTTGGTEPYRHAWYDGSNYVNITYLLDILEWDSGISPITHKITSTSDVTLHLEADSDNVDENHNPKFLMTQDGGIKSFEIGLAGNAGDGLLGTVANDVYLTTQTTAENINWGGATTTRMRLDNGNGNLTLLNGGLTVGSTATINCGTGGLTRSTTDKGMLIGSYDNDGSLVSSTGCIYTMGTSFKPTATDLVNMYGIGYGYGSMLAGVNGDLGSTPANAWGFYAAADGEARFWVNATSGITRQKGISYASNFTLNSDRRLKNSILDYEPRDLGIRWRNFELNSEEGQYRVGVIAQELLETAPELVNQEDPDNYTVNNLDLLNAAMAQKDREIKDLTKRLERLEKLILEK